MATKITVAVNEEHHQLPIQHYAAPLHTDFSMGMPAKILM
jgi:hypothetical protein